MKIRAAPIDIEFEYRLDRLLRIRAASIRDGRIVRPQIPRGTEN